MAGAGSSIPHRHADRARDLRHVHWIVRSVDLAARPAGILGPFAGLKRGSLKLREWNVDL